MRNIIRVNSSLGALFAGLAFTLIAALSPPRFREHTITDSLKSGYQVVAADLNGDGKLDLIAVDQGSSEIAWYENPGWERHVIVTGVTHPINLDAGNPGEDGVPEIALLYEFDMQPARSAGIVALLHHNGDVRKPWIMREIDRVPTAHRVRFSNGSMIMAPLAAAAGPVPIYLYRPPDWKRELLTDELTGILHGIYPGDRELLTASFLGIRIFRPDASGQWRSRHISQGNPEPCPRCGSSDVAPGNGFIAAIEPWHGNQVVVYREHAGAWKRTVIDDSLEDGHALAVGEVGIVAGYRGKNHKVYLYSVNGGGWSRTTIDASGMAAANCILRDLNGDGRPDIVCIGASTHNIKWYESLK